MSVAEAPSQQLVVDAATLSRILALFAPNSGGPVAKQVDASLRSIDLLPGLVAWLSDHTGIYAIGIDEFTAHVPRHISDSLGAALRQYGSDKSTVHDYHKLYAKLVGGRRGDSLTIVEVGVGSTDPAILSNMGPTGVPGGSLRGFEAFFPRAAIIGADIDETILFQTERIACVWCDQTSEQGFAKIDGLLAGRRIDLLIDDGLHAVDANLRTLQFGLSRLAPGGVIVIEDIPERMAWLWKAVGAILAGTYRCVLLRCLNGMTFVCQG